uniref:Bicarbonate transporter-like transmembrane domain-containing protein n=1 Tax=Romanomermis culicivorax TaxID=13658 RepID=A0A915K3F3_ROMCU
MADVSTKRLHLFTFLQLLCFIGLYSVNVFRRSAIAFPFVLIVIALVRHLVFPKIFTEHELIVLDGIPQSKAIDLQEEDLKSDDGK